jgi:hypothetical protein
MAAVKWVDRFVSLALDSGIDAKVTRLSRGWPETVVVSGHTCFVKSVTYNESRDEFFIGVDPKRHRRGGDYVVLCGGRGQQLSEVFVCPWADFFHLLEKGKPVNTYRAPREYWQYKLHLRRRGHGWSFSVQGADTSPEVTSWCHSPRDALSHLTAVE